MSGRVSSEALVVANSTDPDPGYVGDRLEQRGYVLRTVLRDRDEVPTTIEAAGRPGLVLLLGSEWSVHAPVNPAMRDAECALVHAARAASVPLLGLCYGAQMLAHALGGRVSAAPRPEVGLVDLDTTDPHLVPAGPWAAFHLDRLEAPPGATVVASNDCGTQAFMLPGALGVQFHPEVRPEVLDDWAGRFPDLLRDAGLERAGLVDAARSREHASRQAAYSLVDAFLARTVAVSKPVDPTSPR